MSGSSQFSPFTLSPDANATEDFQFLRMDMASWSGDSKGSGDSDNMKQRSLKKKSPRLKSPPAAAPEQALPVPRPAAFIPLKRLGAFVKPSEAYHHPKTGLVHGRIYVQPRGRAQPESVHFCLQDHENKDDLSLHLIAHKEKRRYCIYDGSKGLDESWDLLAVLERVEFHNDAVSYALTTTKDDKLDACVFFNKPNLIQYALQGLPRQLELGLFTKAGHQLSREQAYQVVKDCCKYSESKATSSAYKIVGDSKYLSVHQSLLPYKKGRGNFGLNFQGRGRGASNKNCQMINEIGKITLQMVKYEKGIYHVDYAAPVHGVQAFGFALAQLDL